MTSKPPGSSQPSGVGDLPSARTRKRSAGRSNLPAANRADPAMMIATTTKAASPNKSLPSRGSQGESLILRSARPPVDQLDFDDRHDTRATENDEMAKRYAELRQDRRRSDWHDLAINLVIFITVMAAYLIGLIVLLRIFPYLGPRLAAQIVWLAIAAASGGVAFRLAGRALKQRHIR